MPTRNYKPEQIVGILWQIEVQMENGKTAPQACQEAEIHTQTYYRWRKEYGGLKREQEKRRLFAKKRIRVAVLTRVTMLDAVEQRDNVRIVHRQLLA